MTGYSVSCFFFFYVFPVIAFFFFYGAVVYTLKKRQVGILISAYSSVKVRIAYDDVFFRGKFGILNAQEMTSTFLSRQLLLPIKKTAIELQTCMRRTSSITSIKVDNFL